jgi:16S rRNA (cytosine967-C5)-methyltransferase
VLIDAPCTGSGTWRRRPDAKWRLTPEQLAARVAEQQAILAEGARYVRPGGRLVYITCSILDEENSVQAVAFATGQPQFAAMDAGRAMESFAPALPGRVTKLSTGVLLTPLRTGTDGFYCAMFERRS